MENSPLLSFANSDVTSSTSNLFLGLEWPSLMPPLTFSGNQQQQQDEQAVFITGRTNENVFMDNGHGGGFNLIEQNDDVGIDADLLTLRSTRCSNNIE